MRGWIAATQRARVSPREGDAQKACRRTFVTSSLVCGRNPKQVFGEVGHTSIRMMTDVYDSFIDPAHWPDEMEIAKLRARGHTIIEIMSILGLARSTVGQHLGAVKIRTKCDDYPEGMSGLDLVKHLVSQIEEALE